MYMYTECHFSSTASVCQDQEKDSASATKQLGPNTLAEGTEHKDFCVYTDSKSTGAEGVEINHSSCKEKTTDLADGGVGSGLTLTQPPLSENNANT